MKVLIVDDIKANRVLIKTYLEKEGYSCDIAENGLEALEKARDIKPDLVLLDIQMPVMDGYQACKEMKNDPLLKHIPVVIVTALTDKEARLRSLEAGANDFLTKPINSTELLVRVKNLLKLKEYWDFLQNYSKELEIEVTRRTDELNKSLDQLKKSEEMLMRSYEETIFRLTIVAEFKDEQTAEHIKRVGDYCSLIAKQLGWSDKDINTIRFASPLHDIGKIGIPTDILLKTSKLNFQEYELMKTHTTIGAEILRGSNSEFLRMGERIALTHHENWDGTGYPGGLKEDEIDISGRIMRLADNYDALRSERPYKTPFSHQEAVEIISKGDGITKPEHFDPKILEIFRNSQREFDLIFEDSG